MRAHAESTFTTHDGMAMLYRRWPATGFKPRAGPERREPRHLA